MLSPSWNLVAPAALIIMNFSLFFLVMLEVVASARDFGRRGFARPYVAQAVLMWSVCVCWIVAFSAVLSLLGFQAFALVFGPVAGLATALGPLVAYIAERRRTRVRSRRGERLGCSPAGG